MHYQDLVDDTPGQIRVLAKWLGTELDEERLPELAAAASFQSMKGDAANTAPDRLGVLKDRDAFFRSGPGTHNRDSLPPSEIDHYRTRLATLAPPDLAAWLDR